MWEGHISTQAAQPPPLSDEVAGSEPAALPALSPSGLTDAMSRGSSTRGSAHDEVERSLAAAKSSGAHRRPWPALPGELTCSLLVHSSSLSAGLKEYPSIITDCNGGGAAATCFRFAALRVRIEHALILRPCPSTILQESQAPGWSILSPGMLLN